MLKTVHSGQRPPGEWWRGKGPVRYGGDGGGQFLLKLDFIIRALIEEVSRT
jgi:hypothetical protein